MRCLPRGERGMFCGHSEGVVGAMAFVPCMMVKAGGYREHMLRISECTICLMRRSEASR